MPCFIQSLIIFVEVYHGTNRLLRTSENELVLLIRLERVTKPSLKSLDSTNLVREIVYKWRKFKTTVTFTRNGRPTKSTPKQDVIVCKVAKVPWVTKASKGLSHVG